MKLVNLTPLLTALEAIIDRELPDEQAHPLFDIEFDKFLKDHPGLPNQVLVLAVANAFRQRAERAAQAEFNQQTQLFPN